MLKVEKTRMGNVLLIKPDIFEDFRGQYIETYNLESYTKAGIDIEFVEDDISVSTKHVLRGIHGDPKTWKLVSCLHGVFYLVVVNCFEGSNSFGEWKAFVLSDANRHQVLIPPHYGNAHVVLSDKAIFHYKQSSYYDRKAQFTYRWDDSRFGIWWPIENPILSQRDSELV